MDNLEEVLSRPVWYDTKLPVEKAVAGFDDNPSVVHNISACVYVNVKPPRILICRIPSSHSVDDETGVIPVIET